MSNDILLSLKWNEMKKIHDNLRRIQAILSIRNTCTYPSFASSLFKFMCTSNKSFFVDLQCILQALLCPTKSEVQVVSIIPHGFFKKKKNRNANFLIFKQFYNTISIMHQPFSLNKETTGLLYCSADIHLRIGNSSLKWFRRVFHFRKISQGTSTVGFSVSSRVSPKVSWNDPPISLSKDSGHFLYSWAVRPLCSIPLMLQYSLPHKAESWE